MTDEHGPWENYAPQQDEAGPWTKYRSSTPATAAGAMAGEQIATDDFTTVHLKDGTTLHLKGANLPPEEVSKRVAAFRGTQNSSSAQLSTDTPDEVSRGFLSQSGAQPTLGAQWEATKGFYRSLLNHPVDTVRETAKEALSQAESMQKEIAKANFGLLDVDAMKAAAPYFVKGDYRHGIEAYLGTRVPLGFGAPATALAEGRPKEALGRIVSELLQLRGMAGGPEALVPKGRLRSIANSGKGAEDFAREARETKTAETQEDFQKDAAQTAEENRLELNRARTTHEAEVRKVEHTNDLAKERHSQIADQVRQANESAKQAVKLGVGASQAADHLTNVVSEQLPELAAAETAKAKAAYPIVSGQMPRANLYADLQNIVDDKLKGSGNIPTSLGKILKDTEPLSGKSTGPKFMGYHFDLSNPRDAAQYAKVKAQGAFSPEEISRIEGTSGEPVTFDDLHGMYSELGRDLYRGDLPGDSRAALNSARELVLKEMKNLAEKDKPGTLDQFNKAQRGWMVLENVFRNDRPVSKGGSPLAHALNARDPITGKLRPTYVRSVLTDEKAYPVALDLLKNYESGKEISNAIGFLKQSVRAAKQAPKAAKLKAEPVPPIERPTPDVAGVKLKRPPEAPAVMPFNPEQWRRQTMDKWQASQAPSFRMLRPWLLPIEVVRLLTARLLRNKAFRELIARERNRGAYRGSVAVPQRESK